MSQLVVMGTIVNGNPLLLPDGTVILQHSCSSTWYKLTPDINGSYANGSWSTIASLPSDGAVELLVRLHLRDDGAPGVASGWLCLQAGDQDTIALRVRQHGAPCGRDRSNV